MNITNIVKAVIKKIEVLNVDVIADDIRSGFDKPAFFIQPTLIVNDEMLEIITINIHYFSEDKTQLSNLKMIDRLNSLFGAHILEVSESEGFTIQDIRADINDNVLQYRFDILEEHIVDTINEDEYNKMKYLEMKGV